MSVEEKGARGGRSTVVVAMSGGVDSSVTAALLKQQGYHVIGVTMQLWPSFMPAPEEGGCCSLAAVEDARRVAARLDIPYYVLNFQDIFEREVIQPFTREYLRGRTPNPCIMCNERVKFGSLLIKALQLDAEYVATGHYATIEWNSERGRWLLKKSKDQSKDQTYALYGLTQDQLSRTLMPLGEYTKGEVRQIARELGLPVAQKAESQEICFVPDNDYRAFLSSYAPDACEPGEIVDTSGKVLGHHRGIAFYTIGQRKGLGLTTPEPVYVVEIDADNNRIVVGVADEVFGSRLEVSEPNFISIESLERPLEATAKIRYNVREAPCIIEPKAGPDRGVITRFLRPQRAITPGQSVVWYDGDYVIGGGIIERQAEARSERNERAERN